MILQEIYIQNYPKSQASLYKPLIDLVGEFGGQIVPHHQHEIWYRRPSVRVISLGDTAPVLADEMFVAHDQETILEDFVDFAEDHLREVYLQSLSIEDPTGNLYDFAPTAIPFLGKDSPVTFLAKFKEAIPQTFTLKALGSQGLLRSQVPLDLSRVTLLRSNLPERWEKALKNGSSRPSQSWIVNIFPWLLALLGISSLILAFYLKRQEKSSDHLPSYLRYLSKYIAKDTLPFDLQKYHKTPNRKKWWKF